MESIKHAICMIKPGMFLVSLDIKSFYLVRVSEIDRKFLIFMHKQKHYSFHA